MIFEPTDHSQADALEKIRGSLGTLPLALIRTEQRALKALALNGVVPSRATVASKLYPLTKVFYLVAAEKPSAAVIRFLDFARSEAGRKVLHDAGFHTD